jgi:hypothetical protein
MTALASTLAGVVISTTPVWSSQLADRTSESDASILSSIPKKIVRRTEKHAADLGIEKSTIPNIDTTVLFRRQLGFWPLYELDPEATAIINALYTSDQLLFGLLLPMLNNFNDRGDVSEHASREGLHCKVLMQLLMQ